MSTRVLRETHPVAKVLEQVEQILEKARLELFYDVGTSSLCLQDIDTGLWYAIVELLDNTSVTAIPRTSDTEMLVEKTN
jgi:hypothetical protein